MRWTGFRHPHAWPAQWIRYAWAGGASSTGVHHTGVILAVVPRAEHERYGSPEAFFKARPLPVTGETRRMTIDDWQRSTSVAIQTNEIGLVRISRAAVLTYVVNRKGSVHFDPRRNLTIKKKSRKRREIESHLLDHGLLTTWCAIEVGACQPGRVQPVGGQRRAARSETSPATARWVSA